MLSLRRLAHQASKGRGFHASAAANDKLFNKLLIANRGEIACRVIRTAKRLGIKTVAVYSDADASSQHVAMADEAFRLGPPPASESYLLGERIVEIARKAGAEAVHPGYGFLSENEGFSRACNDSGVTFIGPPERALRDMGSKSASKIIMTNAGVPVTPGYWGEDQSPARLVAEAEKMGFPIMVKAVMGGGGKGMRIVTKMEELLPALEACQREAKSSFGDSRVLMERYLPTPRHVELQVFADKHGNAVYLYERDCSVQRRHQKVLEEAPAPGMDPAVREAMGASAVAAALAVGYEGAGTVEFMLDHDKSYYFMEMNTRLQVEHPVTEMITGLDLVEWQIRVAAGQPLPLNQEQIKARVRGHAIEARVYAENPANNFLPATGQLKHLAAPAQSPHVRVDTGVRQGDSVSIFYDPMISKLIVWGENRADALRHMSSALKEYQVVGLPNNLDFLARTVNHPLFEQGGVDTSFLNYHLKECLPVPGPVPAQVSALAAVASVLRAQSAAASTNATAGAYAADPWAAGDASRPGLPAATGVTFAFQDEEGAKLAKAAAAPAPAAAAPAGKKAKAAPAPDFNAHAFTTVVPLGAGKGFKVTVGKTNPVTFTVSAASLTPVDEDVASRSVITAFKAATRGKRVPGVRADALTATIDGVNVKATAVTVFDTPAADASGFTMTLFPDVSSAAIGVASPDAFQHSYRLAVPSSTLGGSSSAAGGASVKTPMPGKVVKVMAKAGDEVKEGTPVMILEAMKMEHVIKAPVSGVLAAVNFKEGEFVDDGRILVSFNEKTA